MKYAKGKQGGIAGTAGAREKRGCKHESSLINSLYLMNYLDYYSLAAFRPLDIRSDQSS